MTFPEADAGHHQLPDRGDSTDAPQPELAAQFRELVTGRAGQKALEAAGFGAP